MSKIVYFKHCRLNKKCDVGHLEKITWIPEEFAMIGKTIKIRDEEDHNTWSDGWKVTFASETRLAENMLPDYHKGIRGHRDHTGDSLPKN